MEKKLTFFEKILNWISGFLSKIISCFNAEKTFAENGDRQLKKDIEDTSIKRQSGRSRDERLKRTRKSGEKLENSSLTFVELCKQVNQKEQSKSFF